MKGKLVIATLFVAMFAFSAQADLQNVTVGGEIRIELDHVMNWGAQPGPLEVRYPSGLLPKRSIGEFFSGAPAFNGVHLSVSPMTTRSASRRSSR